MMYFMVFNLIFVMNFVSGGDQEEIRRLQSEIGRQRGARRLRRERRLSDGGTGEYWPVIG